MSKQEKIDKAQSNLPLPEQPPVASDWQSADASKVNVESGRVEGHVGTDPHGTTGIRAPATKGTDTEDMSNVGRQGKEGLDAPPKDART